MTGCAEIGRRSQGFVYAVSVMGTTGERDRLAPSAAALAARVKRVTDLPVLLGFGISTPEQAAEAAAVADGVIVGAAVMRRILDGAGPAEAGAFVASLRAALSWPARAMIVRCDDRRRRSRHEEGSSMARYRAIAADLAAKIRDGHYAPGEALPAQRELSAAYGVTLMTLRQALRELERRGADRPAAGQGHLRRPGARLSWPTSWDRCGASPTTCASRATRSAPP